MNTEKEMLEAVAIVSVIKEILEELKSDTFNSEFYQSGKNKHYKDGALYVINRISYMVNQ